MPLPKPRPGLVVRYGYLWRSEAEAGRDEAGKDRPCVVVLAVTRIDGDDVVIVAPITHSQPSEAAYGIEVPPETKERLGLDLERSWIVTTEANRFVWPGPDLRPIPRKVPRTFAYGDVPERILTRVKRQLAANARRGRLGMTGRDDA